MDSTIPTELLDAYYSTTYIIQGGLNIEIHLKRDNQPLNDYLLENGIKSWAFITAENPFSASVGKEANKKLNAVLEQYLTKHHLGYIPGYGKPANDDWEGENSFFITNISRVQAMKIGEQFKQNAIIYGNVDEVAELIRLV